MRAFNELRFRWRWSGGVTEYSRGAAMSAGPRARRGACGFVTRLRGPRRARCPATRLRGSRRVRCPAGGPATRLRPSRRRSTTVPLPSASKILRRVAVRRRGPRRARCPGGGLHSARIPCPSASKILRRVAVRRRLAARSAASTSSSVCESGSFHSAEAASSARSFGESLLEWRRLSTGPSSRCPRGTAASSTWAAAPTAPCARRTTSSTKSAATSGDRPKMKGCWQKKCFAYSWTSATQPSLSRNEKKALRRAFNFSSREPKGSRSPRMMATQGVVDGVKWAAFPGPPPPLCLDFLFLNLFVLLPPPLFFRLYLLDFLRIIYIYI